MNDIEFQRKIYLMHIQMREEQGQLAADKFLDYVLKVAEVLYTHRNEPTGFYDTIGCYDPVK